MYDAKTRELYATLFKTAEAALKTKHAHEIAGALAAHPVVAEAIKKETK